MLTLNSDLIQAWVVTILIPLVRILGFVAIAPFFGNQAISMPIKVAMGILLAIMIAPAAPAMPTVDLLSLRGILIIAEQMIIGLAIGLAVSTFAKTEFQAIQFMPAFLLPQLLLSGLLTPRAAMPRILLDLSNFLPLSYAIDATRKVISNQGSILNDSLIIFLFLALILSAGSLSPVPLLIPLLVSPGLCYRAHTHMHTHVHTLSLSHTHTHAHLHAHARAHTHTYYTHTHTRMRGRALAHMHMHPRRTRALTHAHTHTGAPRQQLLG